MIAAAWEPGVVVQMLERTGAEASRPEGLSQDFGLIDGKYKLSEAQAQAILDLRLHRLTGLEQDKIIEEYGEVLERIARLLEILTDPDRLMAVIRDELMEIREQFGELDEESKDWFANAPAARFAATGPNFKNSSNEKSDIQAGSSLSPSLLLLLRLPRRDSSCLRAFSTSNADESSPGSTQLYRRVLDDAGVADDGDNNDSRCSAKL